MPDKKVILTYQGLKELEEEIQELKVNKRKENCREDQGSQSSRRPV